MHDGSAWRYMHCKVQGYSDRRIGTHKCTRAAQVTVVYRDTLTDSRGNGAVALHVVYMYCQSYCGLQGYSDRGVMVQWLHVLYAYCQSYWGVLRYSDKGEMVQWQLLCYYGVEGYPDRGVMVHWEYT